MSENTSWFKVVIIFVMTYINNFIFKIKSIFSDQSNKDNMENGKLIVSGTGFWEVILKKEPEDIKVNFLDDEENVPCNPKHHDKLEIEIFKKKIQTRHRKQTQHILIIKWNVVGVRTIFWNIHY